MKNKMVIACVLIAAALVSAFCEEAASEQTDAKTVNQNIININVGGTEQQAPADKRVVALNDAQRAMMPKWAAKKSDWFGRKYKLNLDFSDRAAMQQIFRRNKNVGIALSVLGLLFPFPWFWGTCAIYFFRAGAIGHIYKAVTGQHLFAYMPQPCFDKAVCSKDNQMHFAMAIKL